MLSAELAVLVQMFASLVPTSEYVGLAGIIGDRVQTLEKLRNNDYV